MTQLSVLKYKLLARFSIYRLQMSKTRFTWLRIKKPDFTSTLVMSLLIASIYLNVARFGGLFLNL